MKKPYNIVYVLLLLTLVSIYFAFYAGKSDSALMIIAAIIFILTSIFTYSNRKK